MKRAPIVIALLALSCPGQKKPVEPPPPNRCQVNLDDTQLFSKLGTSARAKVIESSADFIGGGFAQARVGDVLLSNDKIRVVIQQPTRTIGPTPYGGAIIDADLVLGNGEPGRDQFGKISPVHAFGRTPRVETVEVLNDGQTGGYAVVAATGPDALLDYVNVPNVLADFIGPVQLRSDPNTDLPLLITTYYVLSPGESRVRMLTAYCNQGRSRILTMTGDIIDAGGENELFNPSGCTQGMGARGCLVDPMTWFGYQADGVAYGYRAYSFADRKAVASNAMLYIAGVSAVLVEGKNRDGLLSWTSSSGEVAGAFGILPSDSRTVLRDFFIESDLARIGASMLTIDNAAKSRLTVTVLDQADRPVPRARISVVGAETSRPVALAVADDLGKARFDVPVGNFRVSSGSPGHGLENPVDVSAPPMGEVQTTVRHGASRTLTVSVVDPFGAPLPAKVIVKCQSGVCANERARFGRFFDLDAAPSDLQAIEFVPVTGVLQVPLPPGSYEVFVSHGPEYSAYPETFPQRGQIVDLSANDAQLRATLAQVVDTAGWISADLHVHAVGSPDSTVPNAVRVASFAAEGVDVLVSTDHDFIADYAPIVRDLGLSSRMSTMIGCEVTPFDYGHQQVYPALFRDGIAGRPVDWAGGDGPSLRLDQLYAQLRDAYPNAVVQMNHPRGGQGGSLTQLRVDTARGTSDAAAATFRMEPNPNATATDSKLFSLDFDALEVMNGLRVDVAVANDWMTFLSRGWVKTATGVSDTHNRDSTTGGYGRTWVFLGPDATVDRFSPDRFVAALKQRRAVASSGPFVTMTAQRADGTGAIAVVGDTLSVPAGTELTLTVDVQAPEWMQFDSIEIYTHAVGRESRGGVANNEWPPARIHRSKSIPVGTLPLEPVPGLNGFAARRAHVVEKFSVSATNDTWFVAMVRSSSATRSLVPLAWPQVRCTSGVCTAIDARPEAFTNAILVDADGSGVYDQFPLQPGQPLQAERANRESRSRVPRFDVTGEELDTMLRLLLEHRHGER